MPTGRGRQIWDDVTQSKVFTQMLQKSGWDDIFAELQSIIHRWWSDGSYSNTKRVRSERDFSGDAEWLNNHRGGTFTMEEFQRDRHISDAEIGAIWEALIRDNIIIYVSGGVYTAAVKSSGYYRGGKYKVNPEFTGSLTKAIAEAKKEAQAGKPDAAKGADGKISGEAASTTPAETPAAPAPAKKPRPGPIDVKDFDLLYQALTVRPGLPDQAIKGYKDYRRIMNKMMKDHPEGQWVFDDRKRRMFVSKPRKPRRPKAPGYAPTASVAGLEGIVQAETNRLMMLHRASLVSSRVISPLNEEG